MTKVFTQYKFFLFEILLGGLRPHKKIAQNTFLAFAQVY